ncbi:acyl-CoA esterase [Zobellella denitrificans]|jgi:acyl-CoA thioesterase YciA|uniref:Acyl-CoA thioester hydrolase n=1 Tax=Zobellella denitrificans TaxID=347534 RepID=A0A231MZR4_9GAMM|nr:acyl-CoA thioester hydrolase YciA [Zobellella denitrificans]ATG74876.1 acyl-CoA thioester hydrolase [Zobellella denitrificans]OXS15697.1 acyl-CoA esterase [Zobellella denitrificans]
MSEELSPRGELLLRTMAMPADTNANGDIFGGWIMSQMDLGGSLLANEIALGRVCTVAVNEMTFTRPVQVGDVVCCYGELLKQGRSSMTIRVEVWVKPVLVPESGPRYRVAGAQFVYVAIDGDGRPRAVSQPALGGTGTAAGGA